MNLIPKPLRIGGQRRYEFNIIGRIELIKIEQRAGFHITEIQFLFQKHSVEHGGEKWHLDQ